MNLLFRRGFEKVSSKAHNKKRKKKELPSVGKSALLGGAAATGAIGATNIVRKAVTDKLESIKVPKSKNPKDFIKQLKPGDIVFSGAQKGSQLGKPMRLNEYFDDFLNSKKKLVRQIGRKKLPINEVDLLKGISGSHLFHAGIYQGKGKLLNSNGVTVKVETLKNSIVGGEAKAYRFKKMPKAEIKKALRVSQSMKGTPYKSVKKQIKFGLRSILDPTKGGKSCKFDPKKGNVCTEVVTKTYSKQLKKRIASHADIRKAKGLDIVARFKNIKTPNRQKFIASVVSPALRATKWTLPAAAVGALGMGAYKAVKNKKREKGS